MSFGAARSLTSEHQLLIVESIRMEFGRKAVLNDVSIKVRAGDSIGLLGKNGEGKSTLLKLIVGLLKPSAGHILLMGENPLHASDAALARMVFVAQNEFPFEAFEPAQALDFCGLHYPNYDANYGRQLLRRFEIPIGRSARLDGHSLGILQRFEIVRALAMRTELVLLDEPIAGIDTQTRQQMLGELTQQCQQHGTALVFSTHILSDLEQLSLDVAVLSHGKICVRERVTTLKSMYRRVCFAGGAPDAGSQALALTSYVAADHSWTGLYRHDALPNLTAKASISLPSLDELFVELTR